MSINSEPDTTNPGLVGPTPDRSGPDGSVVVAGDNGSSGNWGKSDCLQPFLTG